MPGFKALCQATEAALRDTAAGRAFAALLTDQRKEFQEQLLARLRERCDALGPDGLGVRVVHPVNPAAPAKNLGLVMFYLPPHTKNPPGSHETEETYIILEGRGVMTFAEGRQEPVEKGMFIYQGRPDQPRREQDFVPITPKATR